MTPPTVRSERAGLVPLLLSALVLLGVLLAVWDRSPMELTAWFGLLTGSQLPVRTGGPGRPALVLPGLLLAAGLAAVVGPLRAALVVSVVPTPAASTREVVTVKATDVAAVAVASAVAALLAHVLLAGLVSAAVLLLAAAVTGRRWRVHQAAVALAGGSLAAAGASWVVAGLPALPGGPERHASLAVLYVVVVLSWFLSARFSIDQDRARRTAEAAQEMVSDWDEFRQTVGRQLHQGLMQTLSSASWADMSGYDRQTLAALLDQADRDLDALTRRLADDGPGRRR